MSIGWKIETAANACLPTSKRAISNFQEFTLFRIGCQLKRNNQCSFYLRFWVR